MRRRFCALNNVQTTLGSRYHCVALSAYKTEQLNKKKLLNKRMCELCITQFWHLNIKFKRIAFCEESRIMTLINDQLFN